MNFPQLLLKLYMGVGTIKTLKSKIAVIYIFLVIIIAMIGVISGLNVYRLGKAIDGLMTNNYKSIVAASDMSNAVDAQDKAILQYIQFQKTGAIDLFYNADQNFYRAYNVEVNNITETGEQEIVNKIIVDYLNFAKAFSELQDYRNSHSSNEIIEFYNNSVTPRTIAVKQDLEELTHLNEKCMFDRKNDAKINARISLYIILIISSAAALIGLIVSMIYTNRSLRPIYLLTETIKSVKEGELYKQAPVVNEDEIGMLAQEFNGMTKRLYEFEQSTLGNLLEEKNKSVAIVKSISDPLIVLDSNYKILLLNDSCESLFQVREVEALSKHFLETIREIELYDHIFNIINNNASNTEKVIDLVIREKKYYFNTTVTAVRNKEGSVNGVVILLKNVTEFKSLEKIRTDFIATISHEFKTPLTSIMMGVGLMHEKNLGLLNEKQESILDTIKEETEKLTDLVSNLLKLSRIQSDRAIFDIKPCSISQIADNSINNYLNQANSREIMLYSTIEKEMTLINVDAEKITWVLNNLISNALRYTESGDKIIIGANVEDKRIKVYVKDTGKGIPEEYQEKIFDKFVKVDDYEDGTMTTGLGLSIAKEIVEAHGGIIWCESKLDVGSAFIFTLPIENKQ